MKFIDNYQYYHDKRTFLNEVDSSSPKFDDEAWQRMRAAISKILSKYGFFAKLLVKLKIQQHDNLPYKTMATDGYKIYYDPSFVKGMTIKETVFVICHEIMHNVANHFLRSRESYDHDKWNAACDYAINQLIKNMPGMQMPSDALYNIKYDGMSAEKIYNSPDFNPPSMGKWNIGDVGNNGSLKDGHGGYCDKGDEKGEPVKGSCSVDKTVNDNKLKEEWSKRVSSASKGQGNGSPELDRFLKELKEPQINWKSVLKKFIMNTMSKIVNKLPYKRFIHRGKYLEGPTREVEGTSNIVLIIDTSGSIGQDELDVFNTEISRMLGSYQFENIYVLSADDQVRDVQEFKSPKNMKLKKFKGGGGTSFKPAFEWINKNIIKKNKKLGFVVYFTDMYGDAPEKREIKYHKQVMWVLINNDTSDIPFGTKLKVKSKDIIKK